MIDLPKKGEEVPLEDVLRLCTAFRLHDLADKIVDDPPLKTFVSDGCSMWPDTWVGGVDLYPWCLGHDLQYWAGQPGDDYGRLEADAWIMLNVAKHVSIELAETMFRGIRIGGAEWVKSPWRWGYGRTLRGEQDG